MSWAACVGRARLHAIAGVSLQMSLLRLRAFSPLRTQSGYPLATGAVVRNSLEAGQSDNLNTCTKLRSRWLAAQATDRVAAEHDRHARTAEAEVARDRGREAIAARRTERGAEAPAEERERRRVRRDLRRVADGREALAAGPALGVGEPRVERARRDAPLDVRVARLHLSLIHI